MEEPSPTADAVEDSTFTGYARERTRSTARIALAIVTNGSLFVIWILVAWLAQSVSAWVRSYGVNEYFASAFMWASSASTLILTLLYIAADIMREARYLFIAKRQETEGTS